jgi:arabinogalactan endo-1,4-beta-galactosidase
VRRALTTVGLAALAAALAAAPSCAARTATHFDVGADLSSLPRVEAAGVRFRDVDSLADPIALLRSRGFTSVRLRYWHVAPESACGLDATLRMAKRARAAGLSLLLDLQESDTWADPAHQSPPQEWNGLPLALLADSVRADARAVVGALVAQATPPAIVQIGNEVDAGMLWEPGHVRGPDDHEGFARFATLLAAASRGVREASPSTRIVVHVAHGGDATSCVAFFDRLTAAHAGFDAIGVSYYPWWHGSLDALAANLRGLAARFHKDVLVVETAYPWTLHWFDDARNLVGDRSQLLPGFDATPQGQAVFARRLRSVVESVPGGHGAGIWWWEPAWLATPAPGSPWENCALFDSAGTILPAARALGRGESVER